MIEFDKNYKQTREDDKGRDEGLSDDEEEGSDDDLTQEERNIQDLQRVLETAETSNRPRKMVSDMLSLMLCCRTTYHEILRLTYSRYQFMVCQHPQAIQYIRPVSLSFLTSLNFTLHKTTREDLNKITIKQPVDVLPLTTDSEKTSTLLDTWWEAVVHLSRFITPGTLNLFFTCDIASYQLAFNFAAPLATLPPLKSCWIRLAARRDPRIASLARTVSLRCTQGILPSEQAPFRYMDLPRELRLMVLEHTDLVTPLQELNWNKQYHLFWSHAFGVPYGLREIDEHPAFHLRDCRLEDFYDGSFCSVRHSAHASSPGCECWAPPTPIFLAGHGLRDDANEVFFKRNRIIISPHRVDLPVQAMPIDSLLSQFLAYAPDVALNHLRNLEVVFPPLRMTPALHAQMMNYHGWNSAIRSLERKLHSRQLTLSVVVADLEPDDYEMTSRRAIVPDQIHDQVVEVYHALFTPLSCLKTGLRAFYANVAEPLRWQICSAFDSDEEWDERIMLVEDLKGAKDRDMEALVMGNDYDAVKAGKDDYELSQWFIDNQRLDELFK
ncbi:hypothetical protein C1H76_7944 [Elsinoe australis]|uniref:Uncharacterized protein n=1 Tax=Elsinoe australis TaxID=40998 RepID=A0A4U7ATF0_9PEZI|nr:hypothetical protein C1H76_7944 [Elsinoe australis]